MSLEQREVKDNVKQSEPDRKRGCEGEEKKRLRGGKKSLQCRCWCFNSPINRCNNSGVGAYRHQKKSLSYIDANRFRSFESLLHLCVSERKQGE